MARIVSRAEVINNSAEARWRWTISKTRSISEKNSAEDQLSLLLRSSITLAHGTVFTVYNTFPEQLAI